MNPFKVWIGANIESFSREHRHAALCGGQVGVWLPVFIQCRIHIRAGAFAWTWVCSNFDFISEAGPVSSLFEMISSNAFSLLEKMIANESRQRNTYHDDNPLDVVSQRIVAAPLPMISRLGFGFQHARGAMGEEMNRREIYQQSGRGIRVICVYCLPMTILL